MKNQSEAELFLLGQFENILDIVLCSKNQMLIDEISFEPTFEETNKPNDIINSTTSTLENKTKIKQERKDTESVYIKEKTFKTSSSIKGDYLNLPKRQILQKHRKWEKAFKSLQITEKDKHKKVIDIKGTVNFIAETEIEQVIFKAKKREVYVLNLLIDRDSTMEVFNQLIKEFLSSLQHYGVFVSVNIFYLDDALIFRDKNLKIKVGSLYHFSQRNSLTLIVSNCISSSWKSNKVFKLIKELSKYSFCSIVQMLPSHLWLSTSLAKGVQFTFTHGKEDKLSNRNLKSKDESYFFNQNQTLLKIPIIAFEPNAFNAWSSFVIKNRKFQLSGMAFDNVELKEVESYEFTEQERLDGFLENSTDEAKLLSSYIANLPISFDVARMIQEEKLPSSNVTHLSEVFLGGIIKRIEKDNVVRYLFRKVPRDYLKQFVSAHEAYALLELFVNRKLKSSLSLTAFFSNKNGIDSMPIDEDTLELMRLGIDIKKRMGGTDYDEAVVRENELNEIEEKREIKAITPTTKRYQMGSKERKEEQPIHEVTINYDFEISPYLVTFEEYDLYCEARKIEKPNDENWGRGKRPVINVSWEDARAYCEWLSLETKENYRLPTEAEWEFACRADTETKWSFKGDEKDLDKYAWYRKNSYDLGKEHEDYGTQSMGFIRYAW